MKKQIVIDTELYKNYFLLSAFEPATGKIWHFEKYEGKELDTKSISSLMSTCTTISFNGNSFDLGIIYGALSGWSNENLKKFCDDIIKTNLASWQIFRKYEVRIPTNWDHIDIIEVAPGQSSLKIYGARLHAPTVQDLPIEPDAIITAEQRKELRVYCVNDLETTWLLYKSLEKQIDLRRQMSEQYGVDLRSKSDAQIAETVIKSELHKMTGREYRKPNIDDSTVFRYLDPKIISFKTQQLKDIFKLVTTIPFRLADNGSVKMPDELAKAQIKIGDTEYSLGIGGLHSCEKGQAIVCGDDDLLMEQDVAGYYPNIILQQNIAPMSMGAPFLKVYQSIVDRRIKAKKSGDKVTADTLKIACNGSFGKLGSKWSALYAPDLLIQTTITGQLALLMLIEQMEMAGIKVVSANTDGVVLFLKKSLEDEMLNIAFDWMLTTSFELERTDYSAIYSRDVNNYIAIKRDGSVKRKGVYGGFSLAKNPDMMIVYDACANYLSKGIPIEKTITENRDITRFVSVRRVTGGATWRGEYLGKSVRFYYSKTVSDEEQISYKTNSNKVPKSNGARPIMTLPENFPDDINYGKYILEAKNHLKLLGA